MSHKRKVKFQRKRRSARVKAKVQSLVESSGRVRVSVFRSLKHIYAQAIDDRKGVTLCSASSYDVKDSQVRSEVAHKVGQAIAAKLVEKGVKAVLFDRNKYAYHGRVAALAQGMRESGIDV